MEENIILENEMDIPEDWETNTILIRNENDEIIAIDVPDDEEE